MKTKRINAWGLLLLLLTACTTETYDAGDGELSYLRADFVKAHTTAPKTIATATTDEGNELVFAQPIEASWAVTADSTYRALLYYNGEVESKTVRPVSIGRVLVLRPATSDDDDKEEGADPKTDPVGLESVWISANGQWLNLGLLLKSGRADDDEAVQRIGVVPTDAGDEALTLTFTHDQGGIPEYYTSRVYASIPITEDMRGKTLTLRLNTYQGWTERVFDL